MQFTTHIFLKCPLVANFVVLLFDDVQLVYSEFISETDNGSEFCTSKNEREDVKCKAGEAR